MDGSRFRVRWSRSWKVGGHTGLLALCAAAAMGPAQGQAQAPTHPAATEAPGPVGGAPAKLPELNLPNADQLRLLVPRQLQAATAAFGLGRQRLALVVGIGTLGSRQVLDSAARDSLAVATALRAAGFVVMVREDATSQDLRAALKEFQERLQPGAMGLLYVTALGAQLDGRNLLLPRDAPLDAAAPAASVADGLRAKAVPVQELVDALVGTTDSSRMLVLDAAYKHPALAKLPHSGLLAQALPPGMMALFAQSPQTVQDVPAVAPLPSPTPTDPQALAASPFARLLVRSMLTPKLSGAEVLRATHRALVDSTQGGVTPWIAGDTDAKEEMAELTLLDAVLPRTPEEYAREGAKRVVAQMTRPGAARAGEQAVSEVLQPTQAPAPTTTTTTAPTTTTTATPPGTTSTPSLPADNTRTTLPELPSGNSALGSAAKALGTAASVAGTAASVGATVATVAVGLKAAQAVATAQVASTAIGAATAVAGNAVALATRLGSGGAGESGARQVASAAAAAAAPAAAVMPAAPAATLAATLPAPPVAPALAVRPASAAPAAAARNLAGPAEMAVADMLQGVAAAPRPAPAAPTARPAENPGRDGRAANQPPPTDGRTTRNTEGGERPVYTPRSNSHGYAEGDTFSYQVTDTWKGEITGRYTTAIEEVLDNGQLLANGQQVALDAQGRLKSLRHIDGSLQRFEPHQDLWWSKPTPGQSRDVDFKEIFERADKTRGETQFKGSSSVGKLQKIDTPAGEFDALPIETSGWYHEKLANGTLNSGKFERTVWYSPQLGHPVAIDIKDVDRLGKLLKRERVELTHAQQVRSSP